MLEWKLRGYVAPEDFEGSDCEKIQKALDYAKKEDIGRVVLTGVYHGDETIIIPSGMHLVFEGAVLYGNLQNKIVNNYSLVSDRIYIEGRGGEIKGNLYFCHTAHLILEDMKITGDMRLDFCIYPRVERTGISGDLTLGRGCQHGIFQDIECRAVSFLGEDCGYDIMGRYVDIKNIALRRSKIAQGATMKAAEDCIFLNLQLDEISSETVCVTVGEQGKALPREQYQNMTLTNLNAPEKVLFFNETLHTYLGE